MLIGIFAPEHDPQARALSAKLEALQPGCVRRFEVPPRLDAKLILDANRLSWDGQDLSNLEAFFLRGFAYCDPVIPGGELDRDWTVWRWEYLATQQTYSSLHSIFLELERRGARAFNGVDAQQLSFMKPALLETLRQNGLLAPDTLVTNRTEAASAFMKKHGTVVWRPCTGRAMYQAFLEPQREALVSPRKPPPLLAQVVEGALYRGYLFGGAPVLTVQSSAPSDKPPERTEEFWEVPCPIEVLPDLWRLAEVLKAPWVQIFFVAKDGRAWIYDVDTDPLYDALPVALQDRVAERLARRLAGLPIETASAAEAPLQRPTMFLRRMLRTLFEMEETKYS